MRAISRDRYGQADVLELRRLAKPAPGHGEVVVRVHASSVSIGDWMVLTGRPRIMRAAFGLLRPRDHVLGRDVAGVVEAIGPDVTELKVNDEVYGEIDFGAHAEYVAAPAKLFTLKPANLSFEDAAAVPLAGVTALQGLRDAGRLQDIGAFQETAGLQDTGRPQARKHVLVNGASGAVGTFAVQVAKAFGAEVTAVCSGANADFVRSIGADHVIDYSRVDFTTGSKRYDLIFDLAGSHGIRAYRRVLTPSGVYVASTHRLGIMLRAAIIGLTARGRVVVLAAHESRADLEVLRDLIEAGRIRPVIDKRYRLEEVPRAFGDQGAGHARGRKIVQVAS